MNQLPETPTTPSNETCKKPIARTSTEPSKFVTPQTNELTRQTSASPSLASAPISAITHYLKHILGLNAKTTKRSLSEEAECGSPESLAEWLRLGSDPNEIDAYGYTPLINACLRGCTKSAKVLIENGANVNMKAMHGYYPLHAAAQNGYLEIVELLIDNGAEMELKNEDGDTPLMLAVRSDHPSIVDSLCKRGCNMHTQGFDHIEPIDYAINKRNLFISDVLMKHERQHLNTASSGLNETLNHNKVNDNIIQKHPNQSSSANNDDESIKPNMSLTSLIHNEQDKHQNNHINDNHKKYIEPTVFEAD